MLANQWSGCCEKDLLTESLRIMKVRKKEDFLAIKGRSEWKKRKAAYPVSQVIGNRIPELNHIFNLVSSTHPKQSQ